MSGYKITLNDKPLGIFGSNKLDMLGLVFSLRGKLGTKCRNPFEENDSFPTASFSVYGSSESKPTASRYWIRYFPLTLGDNLKIELVVAKKYSSHLCEHKNDVSETTITEDLKNEFGLKIDNFNHQTMSLGGEDFGLIDISLDTKINADISRNDTYLMCGGLRYPKDEISTDVEIIQRTKIDLQSGIFAISVVKL